MKTIVLLLIIICFAGCQSKCDPNTTPSSILFPSKWKLIKLTTQLGKPRAFSTEEMLDLGFLPNGFSETIFQNGKAISTKEVQGWADDCSASTVLMTYKDGTQRNLIIQNNHDLFQIEGTGYVKQLGGTDDTLRYYYQNAL